MKVILAVESIKPPLTGIGRYTWELATRLPQRLGQDSLTYIAHGRWVTLEEALLSDSPSNSPRKKKKLLSRLKNIPRRAMLLLPFASHAYRFLSNRSRLNRADYDLYHGPNYCVPKTKKPSVVTIHDLSTLVNPTWHPTTRVTKITKLLPKAIYNSSLVITDSNAIREEVINEFRLPPERVIAIPLGVDSVFMPRDEDILAPLLATYGLRPKGYSLCVATIEPRKNIDRLIDAYRSLPQQLKNWPLVIIGEAGWNSDELHQKIKQATSEGWLHYLGFVPSDHLPLLYSGACLFVYPSLYEGFGLPVVEALASGVPVITSNCSSMPEVANGAACLVEPKETESIRAGIISCLDDESKRLKMTAAGLLRAKELNWDRCIDLTLDAYKLVLKNS